MSSVNVLHLTESKKQPGQDFRTHGHYDRLQHDLSHLQPLNNIHIKHQPPTLSGFRDIAQTKF